MNLTVDIQCASAAAVPDETDIQRWIAAALASQPGQAEREISVRLVDSPEMAMLNQTYRGRSGPTNVLSFPCELPADVELPLLGDIVVCAPVVAAEAAEQHKSTAAHWAHMLVHGTLHLLGYDHAEAEDAVAMEALESAILADLDYACPYRVSAALEHSLS